jgi:hypothetical protein
MFARTYPLGDFIKIFLKRPRKYKMFSTLPILFL